MRSPVRLLATGLSGQVVQCLVERARAHGDLEVITLGRPYLDLMNTETVAGVVRTAAPDILVSAAAYTSVDLAESHAATAFKINSEAPGALAAVANEMAIPIIHLSTDYVFDGAKTEPYVEADLTNPLGVYGLSKLYGERLVAANTQDYVVLRTAWLFSPFGKNFVGTMLRSSETADELRVVDDQFGNPTSALDLATAILLIGKNLLNSDAPDLRGIFHLAANGDASWADLAEEVFRVSRYLGGSFSNVNRISSADYPTAARRPASSRLSCARAAMHHGICLPHWRDSVGETVRRLISIRAKTETTE